MYGYHFFGRRTLLFFIFLFLEGKRLEIKITIFFHRKANKISYSLVYNLSIIDKREWVFIKNVQNFCRKLSKIIAIALNVNFFFLKFLTTLFIKLKRSGLWNFIRK